MAVGLGVGAGAALVDLLYAGLGVAGAATLLAAVGLRVLLGLAGAAVLILIGARTLWSSLRVRSGFEADVDVSSPFNVGTFRRRLPEGAIRVADGAAGAGIMGYGAALAYGALHQR